MLTSSYVGLTTNQNCKLTFPFIRDLFCSQISCIISIIRSIPIFTIHGIYTDGSDFAGTSGIVRTLTGRGSVVIPISITDDDNLEATENFFGNMNSVLGPLPNVMFDPVRATANIFDNDGNYNDSARYNFYNSSIRNANNDST